MSDIVKELLFRSSDKDGIGWTPPTVVHVPAGLLHQAAAAIRALRAELAEARRNAAKKPDVLSITEACGAVYAAVVETWGVRCHDFNEDCHCCKAWHEYDRLAAPSTGWEWMREEAAKVADGCDDGGSSEGPLTAHHIAASIRALPPPPEGVK